MALSPHGRTLAVAYPNGTVTLWTIATGQITDLTGSGRGDPATGQATAALFGHARFVTTVAFSPDGHTLATGSWDGTVRLWTLG